MTDVELLHDYAAHGSQKAFTALVRRYADLVYSAARRQVGDPGLAEDVTQAVFMVLAKRSAEFRKGSVLGGWLMVTTRFAARNAVVLRARRLQHEQKAATMCPLETEARVGDADISELLPHLDEALTKLAPKDRDALVLRFLQRRGVQEVSRTIGISEDAAQKRIARALDRLRRLLVVRGVAYPVVALAALLSSVPLMAAPDLPFAAADSVSLAMAGNMHKAIFRKAVWRTTRQRIAVVAALAVSLGLLGGLMAGIRPLTPTQPSTARKPPEKVFEAIPKASEVAEAPEKPSPVLTILAASEAWGRNDPIADDKLHPPGTAEEKAYTDAAHSNLSAQQKLIAAWRARAGEPVGTAFPPGALYIRRLTEEQIAGITLVLQEDGKAEVAVPNMPRYRLVLDHEQWKIEILGTIGTRYPADPVKAAKILTEMFGEIKAAFDDTTRQIERGEIATLDGITGAMRGRFSEILPRFDRELAPLQKTAG